MNNNQKPTGTAFFRSRRYLPLAVASFALVLSLVVAFVVGNLVYANLKLKNGQALSELAFHMAETLDNGLYERFGDLMQLKNSPDLLGFLRNPRQLRTYFEYQQRFFPEYAWLGFVKPDGTVLAGSGGLLEGRNIAERGWVKAGRQAAYAGDVHDALLLSSLLPRPQDGEPLRLLDVALPVHDAHHRLLGVMGAHLSWQWVKDIRNNLLTHDLKNRRIEILVLNSKGSVLLGSSGNASNGVDLSRLESFRLARETKVGSLFERWPDGGWYNTGYARGKGHRDFSGLNWVVLARQSDAVALAEAAEIRYKILLLGVLAGLFTGTICWLGARWALQPIELVTAAAQKLRLRGGALPEAIHLPRRDEISVFAETMYDQLVDMLRREEQLMLENAHLWSEVERFRSVELRLAEMRRGLELRVLERTADLQETTTALMRVRDEAEQAKTDMGSRIAAMEQQLGRLEATLTCCRAELELQADRSDLLARVSHDLEQLRTLPGGQAGGAAGPASTSSGLVQP